MTKLFEQCNFVDFYYSFVGVTFPPECKLPLLSKHTSKDHTTQLCIIFARILSFLFFSLLSLCFFCLHTLSRLSIYTFLFCLLSYVFSFILLSFLFDLGHIPLEILETTMQPDTILRKLKSTFIICPFSSF